MDSNFESIDSYLTSLFARYGTFVLRVTLGLIFLWFGVLKFFPGTSSAECLAGETISCLTFGFVPQRISLPLLAVLETTIGIGLILGLYLRAVLFLLAFQMLGTFTPLLLFPELTWKAAFVPTLEGQYIIKNLVLIAGAVVVGATVRGGKLTA